MQDKKQPAPRHRAPSDRLIPGVDVLRACSVIGVLLFHWYPRYVPGGYLGVDVFFVISGYVVTRRSLEDTSLPPAKFLLEFYRRRFWRIYPSLVSVVGIGLVVILLFDPYPDASVRTGLSGLIGFANVEQYLYRNDYFVQQVGANAYTHLWSLGIEEQFYFIFPIILLILVRLRRTASKALLLGLPLCISLFVYVAVISSGRASAAFYLFPFRYWEIALGMVLATVDSKIHRLHLGFQRAALFVGFGGIFGSLIAIRPSDSFGPIVSTMSTTLALIGVRHTRFSSKPAKGLLITSLIHIGRRSYSLYLVHWVLLVVFRLTVGTDGKLMAIGIVGTFVLTEMNFRFIENRFRQNRSNTRFLKSSVVLAALLFAFSTSSLLASPNLWYLGHLQDESAFLERRSCVQEGSRRWLVGDSHSNGYGNILSIAFDGDCLQVRDDSTGKSFMFYPEANGIRNGLFYHANLVFLDPSAFIERLIAEKPTELWIVNYLQGYFQEQSTAYASADWTIDEYIFPDGTRTQSPTAGLQYWGMLIELLLTEARKVGTKVIVELPPPDFDWVQQGGLEWRNEESMCTRNWFNPNSQLLYQSVCEMYQRPATVGRSIVEERRYTITKLLTELQTRFGNLNLIDPLEVICTRSECSTHREGIRLFEDDDHYSVAGEQLIADELGTLVEFGAG